MRCTACNSTNTRSVNDHPNMFVCNDCNHSFMDNSFKFNFFKPNPTKGKARKKKKK